MRTNERPKFAQLLTDVMAYYGKDTSVFMLDLWWQACQNFDLGQVQKALNTHAMDAERGVYAPKVADIVRVLQGTTTDRAALAWGKVMGAMGSVGAYQDVIFDDAAIHAAIADCGGWVKMCRGDISELSYLQHRFCQSHKAYVERGSFDYPRQLSGDRSPDSEYLKYGRPLPRPAIVGDPLRAQQVHQAGGAGGPAISFQPIQSVHLALAIEREAA
jgi:hypothetical protein